MQTIKITIKDGKAQSVEIKESPPTAMPPNKPQQKLLTRLGSSERQVRHATA